MKPNTNTKKVKRLTQQGTASEVFRAFLKLGLTSFAGQSHLGVARRAEAF